MSTQTTQISSPSKIVDESGRLQPYRDRYNATARLFHWTIALLIAGMFLTDWMRGAAERGSSGRVWWLSAHESLGLLVLILSIVRLGWRLAHPAPAVRGSPVVSTAAAAGHVLLYLATLGLPLAGICRAMSGGGDVVFFGLVIPSMTGRNSLLSTITHFVHGGLVMNLLLALIAGHVIAALWHQFLRKDGTLQRML